MTDTAAPLLEITGLCRAFNGVPALQDIDLSVNRGESLVVIGESGSGKTLLLKTILGLIEQDSGSIQIDGQDTGDMSTAEHERCIRRFGMLFQRSALFDSLPVWENICFRPLREKRIDVKGAKDLSISKLGMVGLGADVAGLMPSELSGGMQKRVGLARAIADEPEVLFLDEPTAGLDPIMSNVINDMIRQIVSDLGATVISIDSDMAGVRRIADRVVMLQQGRKVWDGASADLDHTDNSDVTTFIGSKPLPTLAERRAG